MKLLYQKTKQGVRFELDAKTATIAALLNALIWLIGKYVGWF